MADYLEPLSATGRSGGRPVSPLSTRSPLSPKPASSFSNNSLSPNALHRMGYQRMDSEEHHGVVDAEDYAVSNTDPIGTNALGIASASSEPLVRSPIARVAVGSKASSKTTSPKTPHFYQSLGNPSPPPATIMHSSWDEPPSATLFPSWGAPNFLDPKHEVQHNTRQTADAAYSIPMSDFSPPLGQKTAYTGADFSKESSEEEFDDEAFRSKFGEAPHYCSSKTDIFTHRSSWLSVIIFILSIYSTAGSGIWLVAAVIQPSWGHQISSRQGLDPSSARLIAALIAKTIEISFVTVFVTCIGQILTRRAFLRKSRGMTLAEMTVRNWVLQPGSLITHFENLQYAGVTFLGALALTATVAATFYTTASEAMVAPKLKLGDWVHHELSGNVRTSYGNVHYALDVCPSLLGRNLDGSAAESCGAVQFSGQSYRNLMSFMANWTLYNQTDTSTDLTDRPSGTMLLYDNTTMYSTWIETQYSDVAEQFERTGHVINNVTMAMPHPGIYAAATDPVNKILQPDDLEGVGRYAIQAGVVSPAINVLCVNLDADELAPLVYTTWPNSNNSATGVGDQLIGRPGWDGQVPPPLKENGQKEYLNETDVDDIFRWGERYGRRPPVFQLYPSNYNLLTNSSVSDSDALYMLGKSPNITEYTLCEMRSWVSPNCSTRFDISGTAGASMRAHCEDPDDANSYLQSFSTPQNWSGPSTDWKWTADTWKLSMDLNGGSYNNNASNARIITQLALQEPRLPRELPSIAEALAVFASSTIVIGSIDTPFVHYWDGETPTVEGLTQPFNASLIMQQYTSGYVEDWHVIFYVVLVLVFGINLFCMSYFLLRSGLVTDFTEPQNLFALAINSPPSAQVQGSCGGGPQNRDLVVPWRVAYAPSANHYFFEEANERPWRGRYAQEAVSTARDLGAKKDSSYNRLSKDKMWL
ncbi:hypothetical protein S40293_06833 [Stachybotrys chartarum IBT 40293]|nr:hypothetical protein S40293_06833 [Stachybotrys chartarum IBT 40293]